jgi:hypothetical protein
MKEFKLDEHPKITTGFKVPEDYFDNFSARMMQQLAEPEVKVIPLSTNRKSWFFAAAAVLVLALTIPALNQFSATENQPDQAQLENYLAYAQIPDEEIVALLEDEDIQNIDIDYSLEDNDIEEVLSSDKTLETYIN